MISCTQPSHSIYDILLQLNVVVYFCNGFAKKAGAHLLVKKCLQHLSVSKQTCREAEITGNGGNGVVWSNVGQT
jgi:hypothetical protein